jgi:surfeit locus 1 family protein
LRSRHKLWVVYALALVGVAGFIALGVWQLERRVWKLALIERVEQRVHAAPVAAPGPAEWRALTAANAEYRRVSATGRFLDDRDTLVQAVTALGGGFWVMTPFRTNEGFVVLVNRGFVPSNERDPTSRPETGPTASTPRWREAAGVAPSGDDVVTGLLRISEPKGGFLRANDPAANRWYSRDVSAISQAQGLTATAPYFIDAEASAAAAAGASARTLDAAGVSTPVPGLTVISFHNSHLLYAATWFALALLLAGLAAQIARHELHATD